MKPEPLTKEKIHKVEGVLWSKGLEGAIVGINSLKSAVEWLLKEIEKEFLKTSKGKDYDTVAFFSGLEARIISKIKKAFSGVLRE